MRKADSLLVGMLRTTVMLFLFQASLYIILAVAFQIAPQTVFIFLAVCVCFHAGLLLGMIKLKRLFVHYRDNTPLTRINPSNILSLFRVSSIPTIIFMLLSNRIGSLVFVVIPFIVIVFLTDLLDGYLARRWDQVTVIGRYLDSTSDYLVLFSTSLVLLRYQAIPLWFFFLLFLRLLVMTGGNLILFLRNGQVDPKSSYLGKASVFAVMGLFAFEILKFAMVQSNISFEWQKQLFVYLGYLVYMVTGVLIVSIFEKIDYLVSSLKSPVSPH